MLAQTELIFSWTSDGLQLPGVHFPSDQKDLCVLFIHGMSGSYIGDYIGHALGEGLQHENIGFIFTHNRGSSHIHYFPQKDSTGNKRYIKQGVVYERFEKSVNDIEAWVEKAKEIGYKRVVLIGHSLGCSKVIYYFSQKHPDDIQGLVLASPPDMVGLVVKTEYQPNYDELLSEARENVRNKEPQKLLTNLVWDWYQLSSQTFLDLFEEGGPADVLPLLRNPLEFPQLASINLPFLCMMGEFDDIAIRSLSKDMQLIQEKATSCPSFTGEIIAGANHSYEGKESQFTEIIINWLKKERFLYA